LAAIIEPVDNTMRQTQMTRARDLAVRKLRDITIAVAVVATGAVGVIAWLSATGIPGSAVISGLASTVATQDDGQLISSDDGFVQAAPATAQSAPAVAVSGGSHPKP
jgi:hypothetical protein